MSPNVLRRCSLCKRYHASYLVPESEFGKVYLCYDCWKARHASQLPPTPERAKRPAFARPKRRQ
jgi:hypothetical protein